jgi:Tfp pilus assembly protein PilF
MALLAENYEYDRAKAEDSYKRALERSPNDATTHHFYGEFLALTGRFEEAEREMEKAYELDPISLIVQADWARIAVMERKYDLAIERATKALKIDPQFDQAREIRAWACFHRGDAVEALLKDISRARSEISVLARDGHLQQARRRLKELEQQSQTHYISPMMMARNYSFVGEQDRAIGVLEKVIENRESPGVIGLEVDPDFDPLRSSARFQALLAKLGAKEPDVVRRAALEWQRAHGPRSGLANPH